MERLLSEDEDALRAFCLMFLDDYTWGDTTCPRRAEDSRIQALIEVDRCFPYVRDSSILVDCFIYCCRYIRSELLFGGRTAQSTCAAALKPVSIAPCMHGLTPLRASPQRIRFHRRARPRPPCYQRHAAWDKCFSTSSSFFQSAT